MRSGRNILLLEGHIKPILAMDFSPNGYLLATGSEDNTARIYDLRKRAPLTVLPGALWCSASAWRGVSMVHVATVGVLVLGRQGSCVADGIPHH